MQSPNEKGENEASELEWSFHSTKPDRVIRGTSRGESKVGHPKQDRHPGSLEETSSPPAPLLKALHNGAESIALVTYRLEFIHSELNHTLGMVAPR